MKSANAATNDIKYKGKLHLRTLDPSRGGIGKRLKRAIHELI